MLLVMGCTVAWSSSLGNWETRVWRVLPILGAPTSSPRSAGFRSTYRSHGMSFLSSFLATISGTFLNCLRGDWDFQTLSWTHLAKERHSLARLHQPLFMAISKRQRMMRPADCCTWTMSARRAKPSSLSLEMYPWRRMLTLAVFSSTLSFTGMGTFAASFASSSFSSALTMSCLNSPEREKSLRSSMSFMLGLRCWWYTFMDSWSM
mmetsp:Transcript_22865/g.45567  ORF Transcript_22865/g.45567 Transcript_22865/m.45567 type:complete len:206 (-) Transcript_22865:1100-1717(-)